MLVHLKQSARDEWKHLLEDLISSKIHWMQLSDDELYGVNSIVSKRYQFLPVQEKLERLHGIVTKYNYRRIGQENQLTFLRANSKTGDSIDFTSTCEFKCSYCYVNSPAKKGKDNKDWRIDPTDVLTEIRREALLKYLEERSKISPSYPIRFFSLSDCPDDQIENTVELIKICKSSGTETIVISKNINVFQSKIPDVSSSILYSIDAGYNSPTSIEEYISLYNNNHKIRAFFMVTDFNDLRLFHTWIKRFNLQNFQFVAYHGQYRDTEMNKSPVKIRTTIAPMLLDILTNQLYTKGVGCCYYGRCLTCAFRCGVNKDKEHMFKIKGRIDG